MKELTEEQKQQIAKEVIQSTAIETIGTWILCKYAEMCIDTNAENISLSTSVDIDGERYDIEMVVNTKKSNNEKPTKRN